MRRWKPPKDLDREVRALCIAMNRLPGIKTSESCSGHNKKPFRIWFEVTDFKARGLLTLARCTCRRYYATPFEIKLDHGDFCQVGFLLEGPKGSFREATKLARVLVEHVEDRTKYYNILLGRPSRAVQKARSPMRAYGPDGTPQLLPRRVNSEGEKEW
jgi:hypothetical protein